MNPNPSTFPILSYVMDRLPSIGSKPPASSPVVSDLFSISISIDDCQSAPSKVIAQHMPHLSDPKVMAAMRLAVADVAQSRSVLTALGDRPDHESVDSAKAKLAAIDSGRPDVAETEQRESLEREEEVCKAILKLEELHVAYEKLLKEAEERLVRIYRSAEAGVVEEEEEKVDDVSDQVDEEVVRILQEASSGTGPDRVNLSDRGLGLLPEEFGRISGLVQLDLSNNELQVIPDTIAGLEKLEELNLSTNLLESLPDTIGLLQNLKVLTVSGNKLTALPDSICRCRSLVELDVSFNQLSYLPTNIGELVNLQKLSVQLNKLRSFPSSVCELRSLLSLDAHFNELRGLPQAFGRLSSLHSLNLGSNFTDLTELPDTFGDLASLKELDLSNNQVHDLPETFGCLENLSKLNLDGNPLVVPPPDIVQQGVEVIKVFMRQRLLEILAEEEKKSLLQAQEQEEAGWLTRSTSWLKGYVSGVTGYLSPETPADPILNQQL